MTIPKGLLQFFQGLGLDLRSSQTDIGFNHSTDPAKTVAVDAPADATLRAVYRNYKTPLKLSSRGGLNPGRKISKQVGIIKYEVVTTPNGEQTREIVYEESPAPFDGTSNFDVAVVGVFQGDRTYLKRLPPVDGFLVVEQSPQAIDEEGGGATG